MNELYLIVTSNLKNQDDMRRLIKSVDISEKIHMIFVNQSADNKKLDDIINAKKCSIKEIFAGGLIPLSKARNIGLEYLYSLKTVNTNSFLMFTDDDAWFPLETLEYLLNTEIRCMSLKTIDPVQNKAFSKVSKTSGEVLGFHLVKDIISICLVVPISQLITSKPFFNEKLGLGNKISQGEESLFIYNLHKQGTPIYYDNHLIYHPYKKNFNMKNFYSMSYFWAFGLFNISTIFLWPAVKYLVKYTVGLLLCIKDRRYFTIFKNVWKGFFDGMFDKAKVM